jgi:hypothetical protein
MFTMVNVLAGPHREGSQSAVGVVRVVAEALTNAEVTADAGSGARLTGFVSEWPQSIPSPVPSPVLIPLRRGTWPWQCRIQRSSNRTMRRAFR